ncbi:two-component system regulatory protein YycI [Cellulosilyticum sp. I15G10I2]|uniref:two-component system regulatory protein YycI n=1 Tax=Cellulosilyticum sp. I15G10I2 TaxID=1892843 RepID=UPI00085CDA5E|nr:two-component system regulatory protein YycI [Cellulosilyticum sp. I15G10I2]
MNAGKVLTRLIQVFLAINILLLMMNVIRITTSYVLGRDRITNITSILSSRDISIDVPLPRVFIPQRKGAIIIPESTTEAREQIVKSLLSPNLEDILISTENSSNSNKKPNRIYTRNGTSITFAGDNITYRNANIRADQPIKLRAAKSMSWRFIHKAGLKKVFKNAFVEVISQEEETVLIYYPRFENIPIFDSYITFHIAKDGIIEAFMHMANIESLRIINTRYTIYPIDIVLFGIEDNLDLEKPVRITNIVLGYHALNAEGMDILQQEIVPTYKISIDGLNEPLFVNAYTNKEIK